AGREWRPTELSGYTWEKGSTMARRGTTAEIDMAQLEKLCGLQCTDEEIAAWFGVSTRTIERRRKERAFAVVIERGRAKGRISVRRMQMKLLESGNATMGVWLGKNILGQVDQVNVMSDSPLICMALPQSYVEAREMRAIDVEAVPIQLNAPGICGP